MKNIGLKEHCDAASTECNRLGNSADVRLLFVLAEFLVSWFHFACDYPLPLFLLRGVTVCMQLSTS